MKKLYMVAFISLGMLAITAMTALAIVYPPTIQVVTLTEVQTDCHVGPAYFSLGSMAVVMFVGALFAGLMYEEPKHVA